MHPHLLGHTITIHCTLLTDDTNYKCQTNRFTPASHNLQNEKNLQQNTQIKSLPIKSLQLCLHLYPTHYTNYKKLITLNDRVPCAGAQCCVITTLTTSDTERYTQKQLHKKEFRVPVRNVVHSQH